MTLDRSHFPVAKLLQKDEDWGKCEKKEGDLAAGRIEEDWGRRWRMVMTIFKSWKRSSPVLLLRVTLALKYVKRYWRGKKRLISPYTDDTFIVKNKT